MQEQIVFPDSYSAPATPEADFEALEGMARTLSATGDFRVVRRFRRRTRYADAGGAATKVALFVDTETTGLDSTRDAIIELAVVPFTYTVDGRICEVLTPLTFLEDPGRPIPMEVRELTGITDEMVRGKRIDDGAVLALLQDASLVIAHNARFDRPFVERRLNGFAQLPWACSISDVPWDRHGCGSSKLDYLLYQSCGEFFSAHRAEDDCLAAIHLLATPTCKGALPMRMLLESSQRTTVRLWAVGSPFDTKEQLRARGYRWSGGENGRPKSWYRDVPAPDADAEQAWLAESIYGGNASRIQRDEIGALTRYSARQ